MCYEYEIYRQEQLRTSKQQAEEMKKRAAAGGPAPAKESEKKPATQGEPVPA
ncbi:MAG: hypothetical protein ACREUJ_06610 [Burkholderiales bacterium]